MSDTYSLDLKQLVRVCLNDPSARDEVAAALEEGPLPVRTPVGSIIAGGSRSHIFLRTDRDKSPDESGFLVRDDDGQLLGRLKGAVAKATHDAATMGAEEMAKQMGISPEELKERLKAPE